MKAPSSTRKFGVKIPSDSLTTISKLSTSFMVSMTRGQVWSCVGGVVLMMNE